MTLNSKFIGFFNCIFLLALAGSKPAFAAHQEKSEAKVQSGFQWLARGSEDWDRVHVAFQRELQPDIPSGVVGGTPVLLYKYKYIYKVGVFKTTALVIIGHRETEEEKSGDYFSAHNYDLSNGSKSDIEDADVLWEWKFVKLAQFQPSIPPDAAFTYSSCTECEDQVFLASFQYDPGNNRWKLRKWGPDKHLLVNATPDPGGDVVSFDCLHKLNDWNADGFDDVMVWCREVSRDRRGKTKVQNSTIVYSFKDGHFSSTPISANEEIAKVQAELCRDSTHSTLCKARKN